MKEEVKDVSANFVLVPKCFQGSKVIDAPRASWPAGEVENFLWDDIRIYSLVQPSCLILEEASLNYATNSWVVGSPSSSSFSVLSCVTA